MQTHFDSEENQYKIERIVEASLFMANKPLSFQQLCELSKTDEDTLTKALESLKQKYEEGERAVEILVNSDAKTAAMQVRVKWLPAVAALTEKIELAKKSTKFLALIAKKGELLQSDLRKYFKGDIYEYVGELRDKGYLDRVKKGHSWILKPTKKFHEEFQITVGEMPELPLSEQKQNQDKKEPVEEETVEKESEEKGEVND
ncbi:MAG: SMC-Scp complex subunit ScpB [Candidatus Micrarchaeota archaeon]|nr:SMC-Scp complex subunit ScpB [Candidatus Micrarchaeota archaeon]